MEGAGYNDICAPWILQKKSSSKNGTELTVCALNAVHFVRCVRDSARGLFDLTGKDGNTQDVHYARLFLISFNFFCRGSCFRRYSARDAVDRVRNFFEYTNFTGRRDRVYFAPRLP